MLSAAPPPILSASFASCRPSVFRATSFSGNIAAVTFGGDVLTDCLHSLSGYYLSADRGLDGYVELLTRNQFLEFLAHASAESHGVCLMRQCRERIYTFSV